MKLRNVLKIIGPCLLVVGAIIRIAFPETGLAPYFILPSALICITVYVLGLNMSEADDDDPDGDEPKDLPYRETNLLDAA